jgi:hypothetical protein
VITTFASQQLDQRRGEYRAKADPHGGIRQVVRLVGMIAAADADLSEAVLGGATT